MPDCWLEVSIRKVLRPASSTQGFSRFPCVYWQMLRRFPKFQVATTCFSLDAGLLARSQYSEGPATGHLDTGFSWFPSVYRQMLRRFPKFQVATTCFSCSPPDLNFSNQIQIFYTCKITTATGCTTQMQLINSYYYYHHHHHHHDLTNNLATACSKPRRSHQNLTTKISIQLPIDISA